VLRKQIDDIEKRIAVVTATPDKDCPEYRALASPKPLTVDAIQRLLGVNESLVFFLCGFKEAMFCADPRSLRLADEFDWRRGACGKGRRLPQWA
jgi:hypothetical protein